MKEKYKKGIELKELTEKELINAIYEFSPPVAIGKIKIIFNKNNFKKGLELVEGEWRENMKQYYSPKHNLYIEKGDTETALLKAR